MDRTLTIVGASVRAAAQSALRAGYTVFAGDMFADVDLRQACRATAVADYPRGLAAVVAGRQSGGWMYTGALENSPELVAEMSAVRTLWGNDADVLRRVRNPWLVFDALASEGLRAAPVAPRGELPPRDGSWLRKPIASAGGSHIVSWSEQSCAEVNDARAVYFQKFIEGAAHSAVFVAAHGRAIWLGVTRQLTGEHWCGASGFRYCGSIGPIDLPAAVQRTFEKIAECLVRHFGLCGIFGVDAVIDAEGVWLLEVNPRYTASCELFDRASGVSSVGLHVDACRDGIIPSAFSLPARLQGKATVFARRRVKSECDFTSNESDLNQGTAEFADIPQRGTVIEAGWPIVSVLVDGEDAQIVTGRLQHAAAGVEQWVTPLESLA